MASGSEVSLAIGAKEELQKEGIFVDVVSMPSWDRFEKQPAEYMESVIPKQVKARLGIEMGASLGWHKYVGDQGDVLIIDSFGSSAPGEKLMEEYGFTIPNVVDKFKSLINSSK